MNAGRRNINQKIRTKGTSMYENATERGRQSTIVAGGKFDGWRLQDLPADELEWLRRSRNSELDTRLLKNEIHRRAEVRRAERAKNYQQHRGSGFERVTNYGE
jgi:hypothetical protein